MIITLKTLWLEKLVASAKSLKLDTVEVNLVDDVPYSKIENGKIVAHEPPTTKKEPAEKEKKPVRFPVWRVDEVLVSEGTGEPEFDINTLDEANALAVCAELGISDTAGKKLSDLRKEIWKALYKK